MKLVKQVSHDLMTYGEIVNRECKKFEVGELGIDQLKCLIFVCRLVASRNMNEVSQFG